VRPLTRLNPVPEEIVDAFRAVAPTLEAFARVNGFLIERYRRGKAAWELRCARRQGGEACLTISYRERTGHMLDVSATWWVDDFTSRTRRLVSAKAGAFDRRESPRRLEQLLTDAMNQVDRWAPADLGPPHGPFKDWPAVRAAEGPGEAGEGLPFR
jgi:hypothetical protein